MYYLGILFLVASTLALPTIPSSSNSNEIKENKEWHKNNVDVHKVSLQTDESYAENLDKEDWNEKQEIDEYISDPNHDSKEVEDEEVGNEDEQIEEEENEEAEDEEVEDEEVEIEEAHDKQGSDNEKYSNLKKIVIIKWKVPTSLLLNSLIANMSPPRHVLTPYPYVYKPFRFPLKNVPYPNFFNYQL